MGILSQNEMKLMEFLKGEKKKLFLDFVNAQHEVNQILVTENFISGFRQGAKIMLEILSDDDGCLMDI